MQSHDYTAAWGRFRWMECCFLDASERFAYLFIPKNASMSFRRCGLFQRGLNDTDKLFEYKKLKKPLVNIVLYRDPVSRLVSSYIWHFVRTGRVRGNIKNKFRNFVSSVDPAGKEPLFRSQKICVEDRGISVNEVQVGIPVPFLNEGLLQLSSDYSIGNYEAPFINKSSPSSTNSLMSVIKNDHGLKNKIIEKYKEDYDLYQSVLYRYKEKVDE